MAGLLAGMCLRLLVSSVELPMYLTYRFLPKKAEERRKIILTVWKKGYSEEIFINFFKLFSNFIKKILNNSSVLSVLGAVLTDFLGF